MDNYLQLFLLLMVGGTILPISLTIYYVSVNQMVCSAFGWSLQFDPNNHNFYNVTTTTTYTHSVIFDSITGQSVSEEDEFGGVSAGTKYIQGTEANFLAGQPLGEIDLYFSAHDVGSGIANDTIIAGVFNANNGQLLKNFGTMYAGSIPHDNVKRFYNFTLSGAGYVLPADSVIGSAVLTQPNGDKSGIWADYNNGFDNDHNLIQWVGWHNNTGLDSGAYNNVTQLSYSEVLKNSTGHTVDARILVPINEAGESNTNLFGCMVSTIILYVMPTLSLITIVIGYLIYKRQKSN